jgi:hypothetical protein
MYCGESWEKLSHLLPVIFVRYKILPGNKAEYWAGPGKKIIGMAPKFTKSGFLVPNQAINRK